MAITKHKSVQQMRKDYGELICSSLRISPMPNTPLPSERLPPEQSTCIKNPVPDVTGNLQPLPGTHIQTYSVLYYLDRLSRLRSSLHNQILEKLDRTEKQLEVIKAENRQLMDMVKQLLHRAPKRRKVLVQFLISNTHSCDEQLRMTASTFLTSELLLSVCCVH